MKDLLIDTLIDTVKLIPFLFIAFALIEYTEKKFTEKSFAILNKTRKYGPFFGAVLGLIPQCGFSVLATNMYAARIITLGTLFSIYLATSDELLPIMLSSQAPLGDMLSILFFKLIIGMLAGFIIDLFYQHRSSEIQTVEVFSDEEEGSILSSSLKHTLKTALFILLANLVINLLIYYFTEEAIASLLNKHTFFSPFIAAAIGLIPNCASSIIITQLYLSKIIDFTCALAGLLSNSGVALLVLFKDNKSRKENILIVLTLYLISALSAIILQIFGF